MTDTKATPPQKAGANFYALSAFGRGALFRVFDNL